MTRWVALLRGVNVGGANRLAMADLRDVAAGLGWSDPTTYIQSGNLVFTADGVGRDLADVLRSALGHRVDLAVPVTVRSAAEMAAASTLHPGADGDIDARLLHVVFLDREPAVDTPIDPGRLHDERFTRIGREIYVTYPSGSGRSRLDADAFERAWNVTATARNLNTVRRLAELATG